MFMFRKYIAVLAAAVLVCLLPSVSLAATTRTIKIVSGDKVQIISEDTLIPNSNTQQYP